MKTIFTNFIVAIVIFSNFNVLTQDKKISKGETPAQVSAKNSGRIFQEYSVNKSPEALEFELKLKKAKESGDINESIKLQGEIDAMLNTTTILSDNKISKINLMPDKDTDNIVIDSSKIYTLPDSYIFINAVTTCTEQRGNNIGRIWTIASMGITGGKYLGREIGVFYSDNNGVSWTQYGDFISANFNIDGGTGEVDAEIIEGSNGKYLWIIYESLIPFYGSGGTLLIYDLNSGNYNETELAWPVYDQNFNLSFVSDNSQYLNNSWIYILTQYKDYNNNSYSMGEQVALCLNPYTISPAITYKSGNFMGSVTNSSFIDFNSDIAYFRNGSDSIMIVESSLESNSAISIGTASIFSFLTNSLYRGTINTSSDTRSKAYISSNGAYKDIMILCSRQYSLNDWDIEYYRSTNGSSGWLNGYTDYTYYNTKASKIIGKRNAPGKFYTAFNYFVGNSNGFASACYSDNYVWNPVIYPVSHLETWQDIAPSPAVPNAQLNEDVTLVVWPDYDYQFGQRNLWMSRVNNSIDKNLFLFGAIQGLYDANTDAMIYDTVTVILRNATFPFAKIDSSKKEMYGPGTGQYFLFNNAQNNVPYYVEVKHRNALETWSADPVTFVSDAASIAFSVDAIYAYGNNQIQVDASPYNVFAFYSGDINQDGTIDASDLSGVENDVANSVTGYVPSDLTGDDFVDGSDLSIVENNVSLGVSVITP